MSPSGLGCVKITAPARKLASEPDFNRPKKSHSRRFSVFRVFTLTAFVAAAVPRRARFLLKALATDRHRTSMSAWAIGDMGETICGWQVHCMLPGTTDALEQQIIHKEWRREARLPARRVLNRDQAVRAKSPPVCPQ
jgi:hypothetical protein